MAWKYLFDVSRGVNMNPNYKSEITIYNCYRAADNPKSTKDIWFRTVLPDCFYKNVMGRSEYVNSSPRMDSVYTVRIPVSEKYLSYHEWIKLPDEKRPEYFTCSQKDIVIKGICPEEITGISPGTASQLLSRYKPDAFVVTAFSDNSDSRHAKHYRLGG